VQPLRGIVDENLASRRLQAVLVGCFAVLALVLAATGIYGVMAYSVSRRVQEIGIRMALGARLEDVLSLVLRQGMTLTLAGLVIGLVGGLAVARLLADLLYEIQPHDPPTFGGVTVLLAAVALLACWLPARRAARIDPMVALRTE
jgi:putative ABC transport system permease protein